MPLTELIAPEQLVRIENELVSGAVSLEKLLDSLDKHGAIGIEKTLEAIHGRRP